MSNLKKIIILTAFMVMWTLWMPVAAQADVPASLTTIESEAFMNTDISILDIPDTVTSIGDRAFYGCRSLHDVYIPASVTFIGEDAFSGCADDISFRVKAGSYALTWARDNGFYYSIIFPVPIDSEQFPDDTFRQYVADEFDKDKNGYLSDVEADAVTGIFVSDMNISSLEGIECFEKLKNLTCDRNNLTSLDVSKNTALEYLNCDRNNLTSLDVSKNIALENLFCDSNNLTSLDVSKNMALKVLACQYNNLASLDVSKNTALEEVRCQGNEHIIKATSYSYDLTTLPGNFDVSKASDWDGGSVAGSILTVDWSKRVTYNYDCGLGNIEKFTIRYHITTDVPIDSAHFPDDIFRQYVLDNFDTDKNGYLSYLEVVAGRAINLERTECSSLKGIEYLWNLYFLACEFNNLTSLDVSKNTEMAQLYCSYNNLTSLDLGKNTTLAVLNCDHNHLTSLDVTKNTKLAILYCRYNNLTSLDVSTTDIKGITTGSQEGGLKCSDNEYTIETDSNTIDLSTLPGNFDASKVTVLYSGEDESGNPTFFEFDYFQNTLEVSGWGNYTLRYGYDCGRGNITFTIKWKNSITSPTPTPTKTPTPTPTNTPTPTPTNTPTPTPTNTPTPTPTNTPTPTPTNTPTPTPTNTPMPTPTNTPTPTPTNTPTPTPTNTPIEIPIDSEHFPDDIFREYVENEFDNNKNGYLSNSEVDAVTIDVCNMGISSLVGIEYFDKLESLYCFTNNLTSLDVSNCAALRILNCAENNLTSLDVSNCTALVFLYCDDNNLTSLDVRNCTALKQLWCAENNLTSLDVRNCTALKELDCDPDVTVLR